MHFIEKQILLSMFQNCHCCLILALVFDQNGVLEGRVRHQVCIGLQFPSKGHDLDETLFGLERRIHVFQAHSAQKQQKTHVFVIVVVCF
jgi:hypothetical protein